MDSVKIDFAGSESAHERPENPPERSASLIRRIVVSSLPACCEFNPTAGNIAIP